MNVPDLWLVIEPHLLLQILHAIDAEEAKQVRCNGCPHCNGVLHQANYPRKPRGVKELPPEWDLRFSFCCAECRRRTTPKSVCFLGRKVYLGIVVVVACVLRARGMNLKRAADKFGAAMSTLWRWEVWWREPVIDSLWWAEARAHVIPPIKGGNPVSQLYDRFRQGTADARKALENLLQFVSPLTVPKEYPI